jgi:hypothetical protein
MSDETLGMPIEDLSVKIIIEQLAEVFEIYSLILFPNFKAFLLRFIDDYTHSYELEFLAAGEIYFEDDDILNIFNDSIHFLFNEANMKEIINIIKTKDGQDDDICELLRANIIEEIIEKYYSQEVPGRCPTCDCECSIIFKKSGLCLGCSMSEEEEQFSEYYIFTNLYFIICDYVYKPIINGFIIPKLNETAIVPYSVMED